MPSVHRCLSRRDHTELYNLYGLAVSHGLLVQNVYEGSPAAHAGIRGGTVDQIVEGESYMVGGDIITSFDGVPVNSETRFRDLIASKKPGDTVVVEIHRGKTTSSSSSSLGGFPRRLPLPSGSRLTAAGPLRLG